METFKSPLKSTGNFKETQLMMINYDQWEITTCFHKRLKQIKYNYCFKKSRLYTHTHKKKCMKLTFFSLSRKRVLSGNFVVIRFHIFESTIFEFGTIYDVRKLEAILITSNVTYLSNRTPNAFLQPAPASHFHHTAIYVHYV